MRQSATLHRELIYHAVRYSLPGGAPIVIRFALPLAAVDSSLFDLRRRLFEATLVILLVGAAILFMFFRSFAARVDQLNRFSLRLAQGDFRPLPIERSTDELAKLTESLNQAAGWMDSTIQSLSRERNRSSAILRSMVEGVAVIDAQERLVFSNHAFSQILNLDSAHQRGPPAD